MKIFGVELERGPVRSTAKIGKYNCEVIDCGGEGDCRFYARAMRSDSCFSYNAYGATEQAAVDSLHEAALQTYQELGELLGPVLAEKEKELREMGKPHPHYGDLFTREAWGNSRPDGSYYPADATHYYPGVKMSDRSEKHTHVLYFSK